MNGTLGVRPHTGKLYLSVRHGHQIHIPSFVHGSVVIRKEALRDIGGYRKEFPLGEDWDLLLRLAEIGTVGLLDVPLYLYRLNPGSLTAATHLRGDVLYQLAKEFSRERLLFGTDPLQRNEAMLRIPKASRFHSRWALYGKRSLTATIERQHLRGVGLALLIILLRPHRPAGWQLLATAVRALK